MYEQLIDLFESAGPRLREAVVGLSVAQLQTPTPPGKWSIQELVVHLADSDAIAIDRMKRVLTEENPTLLSADETAYVERLHPNEQSIDDAITLFDVGRRQFARVLRLLPDEAFDRVGTHNVAGEVTLAGLLQGYTDHFQHHLGFLEAKRASWLA